MNAAVVHAFEASPRYTSFADPIAADGEIPVTVAAVGLHPIVRALANGTHYGSSGVLPFVAGIDGVGRTENGQRVYFGIARSPFGSFAERSLAASWMCLPLPDALDDALCAGIANPAMSSYVALAYRAKFVAGESVLILGATGVAGQLAVQIAKWLGARRVIAAGRNIAALNRLKQLGADSVISLELEQDALIAAYHEEFASFGVDVVLDYVWGNPAETLLQVISQKGLQKSSPRIRFIQIGNSAGSTLSLTAATLRSSGLELLGSGFGSASLDLIRKALAEFFVQIAKVPFQFDLRTAPLRDVEALWTAGEQGGRLVFIP